MTAVIRISASEHPVKAVTIFKSTNRAEVVRNFAVDLKSGLTKIEITGLPSALDSDSIRVTGLSSGSGSPVRLHDVVCTISSKDVPVIATTSAYASMSIRDFLANISSNSDAAERVRLLRSRLKSLKSDQHVREHEAELLVTYAKTLNGEHTKPEQMLTFLSSFVATGQESLVAVREIEETIIEVQRRIEVEEEEMRLKQGSARARVDIVVGNEEKDSGEFRKVVLKLSYVVSNVTWEPTYELHAHSSSTGAPASKIKLHYRACIVQSTGEDWKDAALTLSTGSTIAGSAFGGGSARMPILHGVKIKPAFHGRFFGNEGTNIQNKPAGGLFGRAQAANVPAGSIFGPPQNSQSAFGSSGTNAFGQLPQQQQSIGAVQSQSSSLFGAPVQSSQPTYSSFGSSGTSAFGQLPQQQQSTSAVPSQSSSLFGAPVSQPVQGANIFGGGAQTSQSAPFSDDFEEVSIPLDGEHAQATTEVALSRTETVVEETPVAISYLVDKVSIPSDGVKHHVGVAVLSFGGDESNDKDGKRGDVKIEYGVVPRMDTRVYLQCRVKNTSEYRILPGPVVVILNDTYVARTSIGQINPNDTFVCTLGSDPTTSVTYSRSSKNVTSFAGSFAESFKTTTYTTMISLLNNHAFDVPEIRVQDAVPMWDHTFSGESDKVSVILRKPEGLADAKDGQAVVLKDLKGNERTNVKVMWDKEKEGILSWKAKVPAGKREVFVLEWEVKAPSTMSLVETYTKTSPFA